MVLVWPRSTEPLTGSTVKPLCCRDETLSRLKSTTCKAGRFWEHRAGSGSQGARRGRHRWGSQGVPKVELPGIWRGALTFLEDGWLLRMQPTRSSRVAGRAGVSSSSWM